MGSATPSQNSPERSGTPCFRPWPPPCSGAKGQKSSSEEELEPHPDQICLLMEGAWSIEYWGAEERVLPVDVDLGILVWIPVDAGVDGVCLVGPEVGVGQAGGEDVVADIEVAVAGVHLDGTGAGDPAVPDGEVAIRRDVDPPLDLLARQEVIRLREITCLRHASPGAAVG